MSRAFLLLIALLTVQVPPEIDPALRSAVERFFATQESEDADAYLALWSKTAKRPTREQLKYIFDSGDDRFIDLEIAQVTGTPEAPRVLLAVTRMRNALNSTNPDGTPRRFTTRLQFSLVFVREDGEWKLVREGAPIDELAAALIDAVDPAVRVGMLKAEAVLVTSRLVDALTRRADQLAQTSQYRAAMDIYERALEVARAIPDRKAEGHMLQNIANGHYFLREYPAATAMYEKRLALEREERNEEGIASALVGLATIKYSTHDYTPALALYREALAIQERLDDQALVATTLISTANVLFLQGDFDGAIADYRRAETLKRKFFDLGGAAMALEGLGRAHAAQGDYAAALVAFSGLLDESRRRRDVRRQASALQNIGDTHFRLGNIDAARAAFDESRQHYEKIDDLANAGRVVQGTALTELVAGRAPQAEAAYTRSITACTAAKPIGDAECIARALVGVGFAQATQERYVAAIVSYRKSIQAFEGLKAREPAARARVGLAEALTGKGDYADAVKEAFEAQSAAVVLDEDDLLWRALVSQARARRKLNEAAAALGAARAAVSAVQRMAAEALERPGRGVPRDTVTAYATAAILHAAAGDAAAAWTMAEEMRALALRAALAPNERDIAPGMTEEERAAERTLAGELTALHAQRDRERELPKPDKTRLERLDTAIASATAKRRAFHDQLYARLPSLRTWRGLAPAATLDEIKTVVRPGGLVLQFVLDERDLLILSAAPAEDGVAFNAALSEIRRQTVAETIAGALDGSALASEDAWRRAAVEVVKLLPAGVIPQIASARELLVVPDGAFWRVPVEALPVGQGYVGESAPVAYATSVTSLVREPPRAKAQMPDRVVIVAAPELPPAAVESVKATAPSWLLRSAEIAERESASVSAAVDETRRTVLTGAAATEEGVKTSAATASVLHVAAPFRVNAASPLFSGVLLSPPPAAETAGADASRARPPSVWEAREMPNAGIAAQTVVFSDPAALSMRDAAAALPALQWVLRAAGVETVVFRRWSGDEAAAAGMLASFHQRLQAGARTEAALRDARAASRTSGSAPQTWAAWLAISGK